MLPIPARAKMTGSGMLHLFCRGEGCSARLGKHVEESGENGLTTRIELEPRYTNAEHPNYPLGWWWRRKGGAYRDVPRAKDARRVSQALRRSPNQRHRSVGETGLADVVEQVAGPGLIEAVLGLEDWRSLDEQTVREAFGKATFIYGRGRSAAVLRPTPPTGSHVVVCYRCGCPASVEVDSPPLSLTPAL